MTAERRKCRTGRSRAGFWIGGADSGLRWITGFEAVDVAVLRRAESRAKSARRESEAVGEEKMAAAMMKSRNR